jgi:hypothetical protein
MRRQSGLYRGGPSDAARNDQCQHGRDPQGHRAAHFHGRLIVVDYYSLDYSDAAGTGLTTLLNQAITSHAKAVGAIVADAFTAFAHAAAAAGGKTCEAGLLNTTPDNQATCDVHPSQSGAQLLAQAVVYAYQGHGGD